jgi:hypothetical protein
MGAKKIRLRRLLPWIIVFLAHPDSTVLAIPSEPRIASRGSVRFQAFSRFLISKQSEILNGQFKMSKLSPFNLNLSRCEQNKAIEAEDGSGALFARDPWERSSDGSYGVTTCLEDGDLIEKGAASVSIIHGKLTEVSNILPTNDHDK